MDLNYPPLLRGGSGRVGGSAESSGRRGEVGGRGVHIPLAIVIETELGFLWVSLG